MIRASVFLLALFAASTALAQSQTPVVPTQVDVLVIPALGDPLTVTPIATRSTAIGVGSANCNIAPGTNPLPTGTLVNPRSAFFDDPFTAGRLCRADMPVNLPDGTGYRAVAVFVSPTCIDPATGATLTPCPSVRSSVGVPPFDIRPLSIRRAAPTNLAVRP